MTHHIKTFENIDEIQIWLLEQLFQSGDFVVTRMLRTLEICNTSFCLSNPENRITYNSQRKWKHSLAIGEFAWHISGSQNVDFISYYARKWKDFSEDGHMISESCYGYKIFKEEYKGRNQWTRIVNLLKKDIHSRRAVLDLYSSDNGINYFSKDVSCVTTVQFLIRKNRLDAVVNMRSNDIIWGLPYDVYFFTMLQEMLAIELEIELGSYFHNVASMHIYEHHLDLGRRMLVIPKQVIYNQKMESIKDLSVFLKYEELIRTSNIDKEEIDNLSISMYWRQMLYHLFDYKLQKDQIGNKNIR